MNGSPILKEVLQYIEPQALCNSYFAPPYCFNVSEICAKDSSMTGLMSHSGPCPGDSGGPLTCYNINGMDFVVGAVSFGESQCNIGTDHFAPTGYTRVCTALPWIRKTIYEWEKWKKENSKIKIKNEEKAGLKLAQFWDKKTISIKQVLDGFQKLQNFFDSFKGFFETFYCHDDLFVQ